MTDKQTYQWSWQDFDKFPYITVWIAKRKGIQYFSWKICKSGWKMGNIKIGALGSQINLSKSDDLNTKYERLMKVSEKEVL